MLCDTAKVAVFAFYVLLLSVLSWRMCKMDISAMRIAFWSAVYSH